MLLTALLIGQPSNENVMLPTVVYLPYSLGKSYSSGAPRSSYICALHILHNNGSLEDSLCSRRQSLSVLMSVACKDPERVVLQHLISLLNASFSHSRASSKVYCHYYSLRDLDSILRSLSFIVVGM